jgi:DNA-binding LacI/PurR family transcriptional regulator
VTRRATIDDVARAAGVSVATVSRALRNLPNVAPETRLRIQAVAHELDYEPHAQAARLASGKTMTVGLVAPLFGLWYASQVVAGAEAVLSAHGYDLLVHAVDTPDNRQRFLAGASSLRGRVDGLILVDFFATPKQAGRLRTVHRPVVTVGEQIRGFSSVTIDNYAGAALATRHLVSLGHHRIALMTGTSMYGYSSPVPTERARGYRATLADAGIEADPALTIDGDFTTEGGARATEALLELDPHPTALFCLSDEMAMGAMGRARALGMEVPGDLSIVGFDDHDLAEAFGLTTVRQPVRSMGRLAAELLVAPTPALEAEPTEQHVDVELVVRGSTAPA